MIDNQVLNASRGLQRPDTGRLSKSNTAPQVKPPKLVFCDPAPFNPLGVW